jgi:hypothetical protein
MNHVQRSSIQESPSIVISGAREWKMELLAIWQRVFYQECFALSGIGTKGVVEGIYRRAALMVVLGCGVAVMGQVPGGSRCDKGRGLLPATMAAVGALQRGRGRR